MRGVDWQVLVFVKGYLEQVVDPLFRLLVIIHRTHGREHALDARESNALDTIRERRA